jgi:protein phosphatase
MTTTIPSPVTVTAGAATDAGLKRELNEDSYLSSAPLFLVADGMGGYDAGEIASATVVEEFASLAGKPFLDMTTVKSVFERARSRVAALPDDGGAGAGTTLSGVAISEHAGSGYWLVVNVGDSRTYRFARGALEQISVDHSVVQEMVDQGSMSADQARVDSRKNVVTRAIGAGAECDADYWMLPAATGDRILVCSDGLTGEVSDQRIAEVLAQVESAQEAAQQLVEEAVASGGRDNITVVVVDAQQVLGVLSGEDGDGAGLDEDTVPRGDGVGVKGAS